MLSQASSVLRRWAAESSSAETSAADISMGRGLGVFLRAGRRAAAALRGLRVLALSIHPSTLEKRQAVERP